MNFDFFFGHLSWKFGIQVAACDSQGYFGKTFFIEKHLGSVALPPP